MELKFKKVNSKELRNDCIDEIYSVLLIMRMQYIPYIFSPLTFCSINCHTLLNLKVSENIVIF